MPGRPFLASWTAHPARWPLAVLWCGGPAAADLSRKSRDEVIGAAHRQLASAFGMSRGRIRSSIRRIWWHDWNRDPYSRGAYTYLCVGQAEVQRILRSPEQGTLFFGGEATEPEGTVEAAFASGRRAARQVLRALG